MLRRILDAHAGTLPEDVLVCFANTGREMPATLDFIARCGAEWNVPIRWLEYRHRPGKHLYVEVSHDSASRAGEPFDALLAAKSIVPDPFRRFCTEELKIRTIRRFIREQRGWTSWLHVVGLRADETARVEKMARKANDMPYAAPLYVAGVQVLDVWRFWRAQPFDLELAGPHEGNCDGCFMKSSNTLGRMFREHPDRMAWWVEAEKAGRAVKTMVHGRSYAEIQRVARDQGTLPWNDGTPCDEALCGA